MFQIIIPNVSKDAKNKNIKYKNYKNKNNIRSEISLHRLIFYFNQRKRKFLML